MYHLNIDPVDKLNVLFSFVFLLLFQKSTILRFTPLGRLPLQPLLALVRHSQYNIAPFFNQHPNKQNTEEKRKGITNNLNNFPQMSNGAVLIRSRNTVSSKKCHLYLSFDLEHCARYVYVIQPTLFFFVPQTQGGLTCGSSSGTFC